MWTFTAEGRVTTAPVVTAGVVYVGSDDGRLYALDANSGEMLWNFATSDAVRSIPTVADGAVYFGSNDNHVYAVSAARGEELWRYDTGGWAHYSPPVGDGMVYFPANGEYDRSVRAVDAATGGLAWAAERPYPIDHRIAPVFQGGRVYAQGGEPGAFHALDAATGEVDWQVEVEGCVESAPTVLDGVVYLTIHNRAYAFHEATGELIWSMNIEEFPARNFPALVADGIYYLASGDYIHALDAASGEVIWRYDAAGLSAPPVVEGGVLYGASELADDIFALNARTGEVLWTVTTGDFNTHFLLAADGVLYGLLDQGYLFAIDVMDGSILHWGFETGGLSDILHFTVIHGMVYSASPGGGVIAYAAPAPRGDGTRASPSPIATPLSSPEEAERAIRSLPWVADGMTDTEEDVVMQLTYVGSTRPAVLRNLLQMPWIRDGLSPPEVDAILSLASIVSREEESSDRVAGTALLDFIERDDVPILQIVQALNKLGLGWVASPQRVTGEVPSSCRRLWSWWGSPDRTAQARTIPWVKDGINAAEASAFPIVQKLALDTRELFDALVSVQWIKDGLDPKENQVLDSLWRIAGRSFVKWDETAALRIAAMPFLETVNAVDAAAAGSLRRLFRASGTEDYLAQVMEHDTIRDGISDDEAYVVAALAVVVDDRPELLDTILDLGTDAVEKRVITLPLAGEVTLSVLDLRPDHYVTLDLMEPILRAQEEFMGVAYPNTYVGLLVTDATGWGGGGAGLFGVLYVHPANAENAHVIAHELAHTYWSGGPSWLSEGGAEFMTTVSTGRRFSHAECSLGDTLSDLDRIREELWESGQTTYILLTSGCAYVLGRGLFLDLYRTLGDGAFRDGFKRLYVTMRGAELADECAGIERGVCYVRAAFVADAAPEAAALAEPVIDRWYHGPRD